MKVNKDGGFTKNSQMAGSFQNWIVGGRRPHLVTKNKPGKVDQVNEASDSACFHLSTTGVVSTTQFVKERLRPRRGPVNIDSIQLLFVGKSVTRLASAIDLSPPDRLLMGRRPPSPPSRALELTRVRERRRRLWST